MNGKKILMVDDDLAFCEMLSEILTEEGAEVLVEHDGASGIEKALSEHPDLVLFDVMMPVMSGEQFWAGFRRHPDLKTIPMIVLTAKRQYQDKYWGRSMPAQDYFSKPYKFDDLLKRIRQKLIKKAEAIPGPVNPAS